MSCNSEVSSSLPLRCGSNRPVFTSFFFWNLLDLDPTESPSDSNPQMAKEKPVFGGKEPDRRFLKTWIVTNRLLRWYLSQSPGRKNKKKLGLVHSYHDSCLQKVSSPKRCPVFPKEEQMPTLPQHHRSVGCFLVAFMSKTSQKQPTLVVLAIVLLCYKCCLGVKKTPQTTKKCFVWAHRVRIDNKKSAGSARLQNMSFGLSATSLKPHLRASELIG